VGVGRAVGDAEMDPVGPGLAVASVGAPVGVGPGEPPVGGLAASLEDGTAGVALSVGPTPPPEPLPAGVASVGVGVEALADGVGVPLPVGVTGTVTGVDDEPPLLGLFGSAPQANDAPAVAP
jgi:hypothetical protein